MGIPVQESEATPLHADPPEQGSRTLGKDVRRAEVARRQAVPRNEHIPVLDVRDRDAGRVNTGMESEDLVPLRGWMTRERTSSAR